MTAYLRHNGWHFNKKLCDFAVSLMRRMNPATGKSEKIEPMTKDNAATADSVSAEPVYKLVIDENVVEKISSMPSVAEPVPSSEIKPVGVASG